MAQHFLQAAEIGDVDLLNVELGPNAQNIDLLGDAKDENGNNVIHIAVKGGREEFIREAMKWVPNLLSENNNQGRNPLHLAADKGSIDTVKFLATTSHSAPAPTTTTHVGENVTIDIQGRQPPPPAWIETDSNGVTPFLRAMKNGHKEVALYLLDHFESMCDACDYDGYSPLYHAVRNGWEEVAIKMLKSKIIHSRRSNFRNPLSVVPYCSEQVLEMMLSQYQELAERCNEYKEIFLHEWLSDNDDTQKSNALNWLLQLQDTVWSKASKKRAIRHVDNFCDNPLHVASRVGDTEAIKILLDIYLQDNDQDRQPWLQQNNYGDTPLLTAIRGKKEGVALLLLKTDPSSQCRITSMFKESPLFLAVQNNCVQVATTVLESLRQWNVHDASLHTGPNGQNPMHVASNCPGIENYMKEYYSEWAGSKDEEGNTPLHNAAKAGDMQLISTLMQCSAVDKDNKAWIKACEGGHLQALSKLISGQFGANGLRELYNKQIDTPLHHIWLMDKKDYEEFLSKPEIETLKDSKDRNGATPLHRAIEKKDRELTEVLLSMEVNLTIKDKKGRRASDLLTIRCKESQEWETLCKQKGLHAHVSTSAIHAGTNLEEMRGTMAIVAALLATITFAAGIQIPGGFEESTGYAHHPKKLAFIAFLVSDTIAMCFSLLVLFFLIWTPSLGPVESFILTDRITKLLQASLFSTLVAFMSGVYATVSHENLCLAIVVIVFCAFVPFIAFRDILLILIKKCIK